MTKFRRFALSICATLVLATAASPPAEARPRMCPMIYRPVCAVTPMGQRKTFSNSCVARNAHARILYNGRCRYRR